MTVPARQLHIVHMLSVRGQGCDISNIPLYEALRLMVTGPPEEVPDIPENRQLSTALYRRSVQVGLAGAPYTAMSLPLIQAVMPCAFMALRSIEVPLIGSLHAIFELENHSTLCDSQGRPSTNVEECQRSHAVVGM